MASEVKIDIPQLKNVVAGMESEVSTLSTARSRLSNYVSTYRLNVSTSDLQSAISWATGQVPGLRRRLSLAEWLDTQRPDGLPGVVQMPAWEFEQMVSDVPPDQARREGREAVLALLGADGELDPELVALLEQNMHDPYFSAGFANAASPEEISEIVWLINLTNGHLVNPIYGEEFETYPAFLEALGTTLGTATRNTGDLALPDDYAQQWVDLITAPHVDMDYENGVQGGRQVALAMLLEHGMYDTSFLDHVAREVYNHERSFDGDPVWGPVAGDVWDASGTYASDVMPYLMQSLGNNPAAAQNFFNQGGNVTVKLDGEDVQVNARLQYMLHERTWSEDRGSDEAAGLGAALEAATTTFRDRTYRGRVSAQIASQTLALIGEQTGEEGRWRPGGRSQWHMWTGMRENVAVMLGDYAPDLYRIAGDDRYSDSLGGNWYAEANEMFHDGMPYGAAMNREHIENILGTLGQDDDHVTIVLAGLAITQQLALSHALAMELEVNTDATARLLNGETLPRVEGAALASATTAGWLVEAAFTGAKSDEELQEKRAQAMANMINIASTLPIVPKIDDQWLKWLYDQGKSHALRELGSIDRSANSTYGEMDEATQQALRDQTLNSLLAAGYLSDEAIAAANERAGGQTFTPPPDGAFTINDAGEQVFDFESPEFRDWYQVHGGGIEGWVQRLIVAPYNSMWPNIR